MTLAKVKSWQFAVITGMCFEEISSQLILVEHRHPGCSFSSLLSLQFWVAALRGGPRCGRDWHAAVEQ